MPSRGARDADSPPPGPPVSVHEALSRLGMTHEQFQAKQAELISVLLQNQPFNPQNTSTRNLTSGDRPEVIRGRGARSRSSSTSTSSSRPSSPAIPRTPVKPSHHDVPPPRPKDKMELILEAQNRKKELQRRGSTSRSRDDERVLHTPSRSREPASASDRPPVTPHHYKYYSERVVGEASSSKKILDSSVPETPTRSTDARRFKAPQPRYPKTPSGSRHLASSSLPTTPRSSPAPVINLVSSPGPMRSGPLEDEHLPFTLPPGPYSTVKPDLSYAAIIGQAILASPGHALALQDIYEYITTVYPHYKRGEQTWMNSVRHCLSTMAVFRKVTRGRNEGKSLWSILDCDLACFEGGGFKKALCADMVNGTSAPRPSKKRGGDEGGPSRKRRKTVDEQNITLPAPVLPPFFPGYTHTNPHQQSYYQAALERQQVPADALFPPLPPSSNYHRVVARAASIPVMDPPVSSPSNVTGNGDTEVDDNDVIPSSPIERPPSSSSIPDLISTISSSSSPAPSYRSFREGSSRVPSPALSLMYPTTDDEEDADLIAEMLRPISPPRFFAEGAMGRDALSLAENSIPTRERPVSPTPVRRLPRPIPYREWHSRAALSDGPLSPLQSAASTDEIATSFSRPESLLAAFLKEIHEKSERPSTPPRPSTPNRPVTPPPPSTPMHADLPSTPSRFSLLEAELFNFSPHPAPTGLTPKSPSLSVFNARAPLLQTGSIDEMMAADPLPFPAFSPTVPPKTPKKSPQPGHGGVSGPSPRLFPDLGTPSRGSLGSYGSFGSLGNWEEDMARYLSYDNTLVGPTSSMDAGSSSGLHHW